jgi:hypothetical protein
MRALSYDIRASKVYTINISKRGKHDHVLGGPSRHRGVFDRRNKKKATLLFDFDLLDPRLGMPSTKKKRLPLYYTFGNNEGEFNYRIVSDSTIRILPPLYADGTAPPADSTFIELPPQKVKLVETLFDPSHLKDALDYGGIFGFDKLSTADRAKAIRKLTKDYEMFWTNDPPASLEKMLFHSGRSPLVQGVPRSPCPNPDCKNHSYAAEKHFDLAGRLLLILHVIPDEEDEFYELIGGGDYGQLVFELCPECFSVHVSNPCT